MTTVREFFIQLRVYFPIIEKRHGTLSPPSPPTPFSSYAPVIEAVNNTIDETFLLLANMYNHEMGIIITQSIILKGLISLHFELNAKHVL